MDFDKSFEKLLQHEGGYSDNKYDSGGKTMFGITEQVARVNGYQGQMKELPLSVAKSIYKKQYWDAVRANEMPQKLRYGLFDAAVNSGPSQAVKWLQQALNLVPDGVVGIKTLFEANKSDSSEVLLKMLGYRLEFMANLKVWPNFGKGWARRVATILKEGGE